MAIDFNFKIDRDKINEYLRDEQYRAYLIVGVTVALAILYLSFVIIPKFNQLSKVSRKVNDLNDNINLVNSRVKRLDELSKKLDGLKVKQGAYDKQIPAQKEIPELLEGFNTMAKKNNVKILSIIPYEVADGAKGRGAKGKVYYRKMPILVTAKSGYHQLGTFVSDIERGGRFITINDLQIKYDDKFPRKHDVRMTLETYVWVEDEKEEPKKRT